MHAANCDTDRLLRRAADGDLSAAQTLLDRHRKRLKRMVPVHLDDRLDQVRITSLAQPSA